MPIPTEAERVGTTLDGRYVLGPILGRGGMGVVYAAEHTLTGRRVAVKLVRPELADDPRYGDRLFREARAAAALEHPNVVDVLDMGTLEDGGLYLVLERLEGRDLADELEAQGPLPVARVLAIAEPVLDALEALHAAGIVHRDLKPSNVFLARRGSVEQPKLLDFGIAKLHGGGKTTTGRILGTPWYMSPEQAAGDATVGPEADVWAVGAMLFECLTGRLPFDGPTPTAVLMNVLRYDAAPLELPEAPEVATAIRRAMSKGSDRLRTARGLREALVEASRGLPAGGAPGSAQVREARPSTRESPSRESATWAKTVSAERTPESTQSDPEVAGPRGRRKGLVVGVAVALLVLSIVVGLRVLNGPPAEAADVHVEPTPVAASPAPAPRAPAEAEPAAQLAPAAAEPAAVEPTPPESEPTSPTPARAEQTPPTAVEAPTRARAPRDTTSTRSAARPQTSSTPTPPSTEPPAEPPPPEAPRTPSTEPTLRTRW